MTREIDAMFWDAVRVEWGEKGLGAYVDAGDVFKRGTLRCKSVVILYVK